MKHCFNHNSYIKSSKMITSGLRDNNSNIHIKIKEGLILKPNHQIGLIESYNE